jgi:hypothetical protein
MYKDVARAVPRFLLEPRAIVKKVDSLIYDLCRLNTTRFIR